METLTKTYCLKILQMFALPAYNKKSASVPINNYNASITCPIYFFVHYIQSYQIRIKATVGGNSLPCMYLRAYHAAYFINRFNLYTFDM